MGREIRRVPVDFDWPYDKTWQGFLRPDKYDGEPCRACGGHGDTPSSQWLFTLCRRIGMLVDDLAVQERGRALHPYLAEDADPPGDHTLEPTRHGPWVSYPILRPGPDIRDLVTRIDPDLRVDGFGFGDSTRIGYAIFKAILRAGGYATYGEEGEGWGGCLACEGHGSTEKYPGQRAEAEAWVPTPPPTGDGWQLWQTVSEGAPISPVFADAEGLIQWMTTPAAKWGASGPWSEAQARAFVLGPGWAPSGFHTPETGWVDGVTGMTS